jgi:hypothetical protein
MCQKLKRIAIYGQDVMNPYLIQTARVTGNPRNLRKKLEARLSTI